MKQYLLTAYLLFTCLPALAEVDFRLLDVGEGQSLLVRSGEQALLIDVGHPGKSKDLLEKLKNSGVTELKMMVLSHLHPDHAGGYFRIREAYPSVLVVSNCHPLPDTVTPDLTRWVYEALQKDAQHRCVSAGDRWKFADVQFRVLWPNGITSDNLNHHSLVVEMVRHDKRILVMSDVGIDVEKALIEHKALPTGIEVLVVGHHGAGDATGDGLLSYLKPRHAVISVNRDNVRGYPAPEVIQRLHSAEVKVYRTDLQGDIDLRLLMEN